MPGPILNLAAVEVRVTGPAPGPTGATAERYELRCGEIVSRIGRDEDAHDYREGE